MEAGGGAPQHKPPLRRWSPTRVDSVKTFAAGTFAGVCECLVGHPLDTLKVRLQVGDALRTGSASQLLLSTIKKEGFLALYRGASSRITGSAIANSILFGTNGQFRSWLEADATRPLSVPFMIAAAATGFVEGLVYTPIDLVKTRCQVQYGRQVELTPIKAARLLVSKHGVMKGLFAGIGPTLVRDSLGNMAYFGVYEVTKQSLIRARGLEKGDTLTFIAGGGCAGVAYWLLIFPIDTVKSIVQSGESKGKQGASQIAGDLYKSKGTAAFYRGLAPALLRAFPACATTFTSFEWALRGLGVEGR